MNTNQTLIRTTTPANGAQVGTVVSYEDMANPARFFTVIGEVKDAWGTEAQLVDLQTGRIVTKSLRQAGWVVAEARA
jgi:hypothetical protein